MENKSWTVEDFRKYRDQKADEEKAAAKSKYYSKKTIVDGEKFDSLKEAAYYGQCKIRKLTGEILGFRRQVIFSFVLNGVKIGYYKADFVEDIPGGGMQVIDVKSDFTRKLPRYRKQKKLMLAFFNINILER